MFIQWANGRGVWQRQQRAPGPAVCLSWHALYRHWWLGPCTHRYLGGQSQTLPSYRSSSQGQKRRVCMAGRGRSVSVQRSSLAGGRKRPAPRADAGGPELVHAVVHRVEGGDPGLKGVAQRRPLRPKKLHSWGVPGPLPAVGGLRRVQLVAQHELHPHDEG